MSTATFPLPRNSYNVLDAEVRSRRRDLILTRSGLLLLAFGQFMLTASAYFLDRYTDEYTTLFVGILPSLVGGALIVLGRRSFGPLHSRYSLSGLVLYAAGGFTLLYLLSTAWLSLEFSLIHDVRSFYLLFLEAGWIRLVGIVATTLGLLLFSYSLQPLRGRLLLWLAWLMSISQYWFLNPFVPRSFLPEWAFSDGLVLGYLSSTLFIFAFAIAGYRPQRNLRS